MTIQYNLEQGSSPSFKYYFFAHCCILLLSCNRVIKKSIDFAELTVFLYVMYKGEIERRGKI